MDAERSRAHEAFIADANALSRRLRAIGRPIAWRTTCGDHTTLAGRKALGDLACLIAFVLSVSAR